MDRWSGILGIVFVLGLAYICCPRKKAINFRLVISALLLQLFLAAIFLKTSIGPRLFHMLGHFITHYIEKSANVGSRFVFGFLVDQGILSQTIGSQYAFIFFFNLTATLIFISLLINILYHLGIMQKVVQICAKGIHKILPISGSEAVSAVGSAIVGQVEAQMMIRPYLQTMTISELICSMSGSLACISGSIMVVYISLGIDPAYLMAASVMAIPGAIAISKLVFPETNPQAITGGTTIVQPHRYTNLLEAISAGCSDGLKVSVNIAAMLIGFLALIHLINLGMNAIDEGFSLSTLFGWVFTPIAWLVGTPAEDVRKVGALFGQKLVINEFVAFIDLKKAIDAQSLSPKSIVICSIALCSFANFSSVGIQLGGIGSLVPQRRGDLAKIGLKALFCGTLVSYLSASIAGIFL